MTTTEDLGNASSRDRVLAAAVAMIGENAGARLSVRGVAARAGVSTGSLRYHFPTQRTLLDAALDAIYGAMMDDDRILDRTIPARDRLVECLRQVLAPAGVGDEARRRWRIAFESFILPEPTDGIRSGYLAYAREGQRRIEYWLGELTAEGVLAPGDNARRGRFLSTVLNGLSIERALPSDDTILAHETEALYAAVDSVLASPS